MKRIGLLLFLLLGQSLGNLLLKAQCKAVFTAPVTACAGYPVSFAYYDTAGGHRAYWDFGDVFSGILNNSSDSLTSHIYLTPGKYQVTLVVKNSSGCSDTLVKSLTIFKKPIADFTYTNNCKNLKTAYTNTSVADTADALNKYFWDLGSSVKAYSKDTAVSYSSTGTLSIELRVASVSGCRDTVVKSLKINPQPVGRTDKSEICKNGQVTLKADTLGGATYYTWDFGDGTSFVQQNIAHVYSGTGWVFPVLTVDFSGNKCTVKADSIKVRNLPDASFAVPDSVQCFNNNKVCVKLKGNRKDIKYRSVLFDDGFVDDFSPLSDSVLCHSYSDVAGGKYSITVDLTDSFGCSSSVTKTDIITIHKQIKAGFTLTAGNGCFRTDIQPVNTSNQVPPGITKFRWDFADGNIDTLRWSNFTYTYTTDGSFRVKLWIKNTLGCEDSFAAAQPVKNTNFVMDARIDTTIGICRNNNRVFFKQTPVPGALIEWYMGNSSSPFNTYNVQYSYNFPGVYRPYVRISKNGCDSVRQLDSVVIHGPFARFGNIVNRFQCQVKDTVTYFNNTFLFRNQSNSVFWDAGDSTAPLCSYNTSGNINLGMNCRYSTDSAFFRHMYKKGREGCYTVKLKVVDTVLGCTDSTFTPIALMPPKAKGLFTPSILKPCPGPDPYKTVYFDVNKPEPVCVKYAWWVMWDSLKSQQSGNFNAGWNFNSNGHNYQYTDYAGDSLGNVTVGLIVENGLDTNGNVCRDTGWFHFVMKVTRINPKFTTTYNPALQYCKNSTFRFSLQDSMLDSIASVTWYWGDGTQTVSNDLKSKYHTFKKAGSYTVMVAMQHKNGCSGTDSTHVSVGFEQDILITAPEHCVNEQFDIKQNNYYFNPFPGGNYYWNDPGRALAGKEKVRYDLNDGNGFNDLGPNPRISYTHPGDYLIRMESRDSMGCTDTFITSQTVKISAVYASFVGPGDTVLCPQSIKFTSTATVVDSSVMQKRAGDFIKAYEWNYGSAYPKNYFANPQRYFNTGTYPITLKVTNNYGCSDSVKKTLVVAGPVSRFSFVSDTVGCEPLKVSFDNQSSNATNYIWKFSDITNSTFITDSDTNVSFKYKGYGKFYPLLVARGTFVVNGSTRVCESVFPDTSTVFKKEITVYELPKPDFTWTTNCATVTTDFKYTGKINTGTVNNVKWYFGDGSTSTLQDPSHHYSDTGTYHVVLVAYSDRGCEDSMVKNIVVSPVPIARFGFTTSCFSKPTLFADSSIAYNDRIYLWNWSFGDGGVSGLRNPSHTYTKDTVFSVRLKITNIAGCSDSTVKNVQVLSKPYPNFSFSNACQKSTATFTNTSVSKTSTALWTWRMGEGTVYSTQNVQHLYQSPGNYIVKLIQETVDGCKDSVSRIFTLYPRPQAGFATDKNSACLRGNQFAFTDSSRIKTGSYTVKYYFDDGDSSILSNPVHRYLTFAAYNVKLVTTSNLGCRDTVAHTLDVYPMPVSAWIVNQSSQCQRGNKFVFTDNGSIVSGNYSRLWELGSGNTATDSTFSYTFSDTGLHLVKLILTSTQNCRDTSVKTLRTWPMPVASFVVNDSTQCLRDNQFVFANKSTLAWGVAYTQWQLGDSTNLTLLNPSHVYGKYGVFKVSLIQQSNFNCADTYSRNVEVYPMPKAAYTVNIAGQCLNNNNFAFSNNSTIPYGTINYNWLFGDGNNTTTTSPAHTYLNYGSYTTTLQAMSAAGCGDTTNLPVTVYPMPVIGFAVNNPGQCVNNQQFVFNDTSTIATGSLTRKWNFGDTTFSVLKNPVKTYNYAAVFKVKLMQHSDKNCIDSLVKLITVYPKPAVKFAVNDSDQCLRNNNFAFVNQSNISSGSNNYTWKFGDGTVVNALNTNHAYLVHNTYTVKLLALSNYNCSDSVWTNIIVYPMPKADFTINDTDQCLQQNQFNFTNTATIAYGTLTHYWNYGNTHLDTLKNGNNIYKAIGKYQVKLTSVSLYGCADSVRKNVLVDPMPTVNFAINKDSQCVNNQNFIFTDNSSIDWGTLQRNWHFDDGGTSLQAATTHFFATDTVHNARLVQTSDKGCADSLTKQVVVHSKPFPAFVANDSAQCLKQNHYRFINSTFIRKGSLSYYWLFGDGTHADSALPEHKYGNYGNYEIKMYASSNYGCIDSLKKYIRVSPMPVVLFAVNDTGQCLNNQQFVFTNNSNIAEGNLTPLWKLGDGSFSLSKDTVKQYTYDTQYRVWLIETSGEGCTDSTQSRLEVYPKPIVNFSINDSIQCLRQNNFVLTNLSKIKYGTLTWQWQTGDGYTSNAQDISHKYAIDSNFVITLRSTSDLGCTDTLTKQVIIGSMPVVDFTINDNTQCLREQDFIFTNKTTLKNGTLNHWWNFGDANTYNGLDTHHVYVAIGNYQVKLIETTQYNCIDSMSKGVWVNPNGKAFFTANDSDQCLNQQNYIFTDKSMVNPGKIVTLNWDLGNGNTDNASVVKAFYNKSGSYRVRLIVATDSGCIDSFVNYTRVYPKPVADFSINDSAQCLFQNNYVFNDASFDSAGLALYNWDINNGENKQNTKVANYKFSTSGYKNIKLIATSLRGCADTFERKVFVKPMPDPKFEVLKDYYCELTGPYNFMPNTPGGTYYGANVNNNVYFPVRLWADTVKYVVTVNGCTDSSQRYTKVYPSPKVNLGNDTTLCKLEVLNLDASFWQSVYAWNGGTSTSQFRITKPGRYWVKVTNICGEKSDTIEVNYRDINCRFFLPTAFTPNNDTKNDYYKPVMFNVDEMNMQIYDRWGGKVYEGNINDPGWDGNIRGAFAPNGVYVVRVRYVYASGTRRFIQVESTTVQLMR